MSKIAKGAMWFVIGLLVLFSILAETIPDIQGAAGNITAIPFLPSIIGTVADFWWVGVLLLIIGIVFTTRAGGNMRRRFSRRRRRRR